MGVVSQMFDIERYDGNATQLTLLVSELAAALKGWNPWNQLSFALSVFPHSQAQFYDHLAISRLVDYVFVMACAYLDPTCGHPCSGASVLLTSFLATDDEWPYEAFPHKTSTAAANSDLRALNHTVAEYESIGVSPAKLVIGLPWVSLRQSLLCCPRICPWPSSASDFRQLISVRELLAAVWQRFSLR